MGARSGDRFAEVEVASRHELRAWLERHHDQAEGIWLVTWKKAVPDKYVTREEVLDELTAFGWCDGRMMRLDDTRVMQQVSPRRTRPWARSYQVRAERLITEGRMHPAGQAVVDAARADGSWDAMNDVDALEVPDDLLAALRAAPPADQHFAAFPPSTRRSILRWIASARTPATRDKRIRSTVGEARHNRRVASHG